MKISGKFILKVAGTLTVISLVVAALLGLVDNVTADKIAAIDAENTRIAMSAVVPEGSEFTDKLDIPEAVAAAASAQGGTPVSYTHLKPVADPDSLTPEQLVEIVKNAGIVGQGGATFPTHVKISSGLGKVDYVIINAAECEPYITGDHRTCLELSLIHIWPACQMTKPE